MDMRKTVGVFGLAFGLLLAGSATVRAAAFTWDGDTDTDFGTNTNYVGDPAAPANAPGANDTFTFAGATNTNIVVDDGGSTWQGIQSFDFTGAAAAFTFTANAAGDDFEFDNGVANTITNNTAFTHIFNNEIITGNTSMGVTLNNVGGGLIFNGDWTLNSALTLTATNGLMNVNGVIGETGVQNVVIGAGAGTVELNGANNYSGTTTVNAATVVLGDNAAFGTSAVTLNAGAILQSDNDARNVANALTVSGDFSVTGANDLELSGAVGMGDLGAGTRTITVANGGEVELSGAVTASNGTVVKAGADELELSNNNTATLTADIRIDAGTLGITTNGAQGAGALDLNGGTLEVNIAGAPDVTNNVTVSADSTLTITQNAQMSGGFTAAGGITTTKNGAGVLTLSNDNSATYSGNWQVDAGTIIATDAGAFGDGTGTLVLNGGTIQYDTGGTPDYTNNMTISGPFTFNTQQDTTVSGVLTGAGNITRTGVAGTTLLVSGISPAYTGRIDNTIGILRLDGTTGGDVTNFAGAFMQGVGTVGGDLTNNGTLNPGNSVGTINVAGNYIENGTLVAEVDPSLGGIFPPNGIFPTNPGAHDVVNVTGTATFGAASNINVTSLAKGYVADGDTFAIVQTAGGVVDGGVTVADNFGFITFTGSIVGTNYVVTANRTTYTAAVAAPNRIQVARGLDLLAAATPQTANNDAETLLAEMDSIATLADFQSALDHLSPERFDVLDRTARRAAQAFVGVQTDYLNMRRQGNTSFATAVASGASSDNLDGMLASASNDPYLIGQALQAAAAGAVNEPDERLGGFVRGIGAFVADDNTADRTGFDADIFGGEAGLDWFVSPDLLIGVAFGYVNSDVDFKGLGGEADVDTVRFGGYLSWTPAVDWYVDASFSYGYHMNDTTRPVVVGVLTRTATAEYNAHDFTFYGGLGYDLAPGDDVTLTPTASLQYTYLYQEDFTESGAGAMNLHVDDQATHSLESALGLRGAVVIRTDGDVTFVPEANLAWKHEFLADHEDITARFVNAAGSFDIRRGDPDRDALSFGGGCTALLGDNASLFLRYQGDLYNDGDAHGISGGLMIRF